MRRVRDSEGGSVYVLTKRDELIDWLAVHELSGRGLATKAGLSQGTVNGLLAGRHSIVNRKTAFKIAKALGVPPTFFFRPLLEAVSTSEIRAS